MDSNILNQLARIGHQVWSDGMREAGWRFGVRYSEDNRTHDALVAFDELPDIDQRLTMLRIEAEHVVQKLGELATPDRSDTRPFAAVELRVGLPVGWASTEDVPAEPGAVESWSLDDETGDVLEVSVRWRDGSITSVSAHDGLLRRIED